mmetsp:Transcript_4093/g.9781  ORF Transcript_4093/g.9781 Transcript_4093/m.9781 type:complete len:294 (+) Transcript_4093:64-945(+)
MATPIEDKVNAREISPMTKEEEESFNDVVATLNAKDKAWVKANPLDLVIIVRGFFDEKDRQKATIDACTRIYEWRDKVDFHGTLMTQFHEKFRDFHSWWPEEVHGTDKHGHTLHVLRIGEVLAAKLETLEPLEIEYLQGQRMMAYSIYKQKRAKERGEQRYLHTLVIDLAGVSLNLTASKKRAVLKCILDIGSHYFPESVYKIYLTCVPMLFRAAWSVIKPWLHPATAAKVNLLGAYPAALAQMGKEGIPASSCPKWLGGTSEGVSALKLIEDTVAERKMMNMSKLAAALPQA